MTQSKALNVSNDVKRSDHLRLNTQIQGCLHTSSHFSLLEDQLSRGPLFIYVRARAREGSCARNVKEMQRQGTIKRAVVIEYDCH